MYILINQYTFFSSPLSLFVSYTESNYYIFFLISKTWKFCLGLILKLQRPIEPSFVHCEDIHMLVLKRGPVSVCDI
jgi:hypothetical protein